MKDMRTGLRDPRRPRAGDNSARVAKIKIGHAISLAMAEGASEALKANLDD